MIKPRSSFITMKLLLLILAALLVTSRAAVILPYGPGGQTFQLTALPDIRLLPDLWLTFRLQPDGLWVEGKGLELGPVLPDGLPIDPGSLWSRLAVVPASEGRNLTFRTVSGLLGWLTVDLGADLRIGTGYLADSRSEMPIAGVPEIRTEIVLLTFALICLLRRKRTTEQ